MPTPYNLPIQEHCSTCSVRKEHGFCRLPVHSLAALDAMRFSVTYPKGSLLFVQGETPRGIFILCSGSAKLSTTSRSGRSLMLRIAEAGDVLGLSATMTGNAYEVSAETLEPSQVSLIGRDDFLRFVRSEPAVCFQAALQLSERYHEAQTELRELVLAQNAAEKLAQLVLHWSERSTEQTTEGIRVKVLLTHEEIAQIIGTTRETVTRLLSDLRRRHVIDVRGSTIVVRQPEQLRAVVTT